MKTYPSLVKTVFGFLKNGIFTSTECFPVLMLFLKIIFLFALVKYDSIAWSLLSATIFYFIADGFEEDYFD